MLRILFPTVLIALVMIMIWGVEERIEKFKKDLKIFGKGTNESFYFAALYGAFFKLDETKDTFVKDREVLESVLGTQFLNCL